MKLLVIGDFHGELSKKLESKIKKEKPDLILSPGDFCGSEVMSKFFFEKIYDKNEDEISLKDVLIYKALEMVAFEAGVFLVKRLKKLKIPFVSIRGNWDPTPFGSDLVGELDEEDLEKIKAFEKLQTKKFSFVDMGLKEFDSFVLVGGASSTSPQRVKKGMIEKLIKKKEMTKKDARKYVSDLKKNWDKRQKLYEKNFASAVEIKKRTGKRIIFLTHNCPYKTKLDKVKKGPANGKHYGSYQEKLVIKKYKPDLVFCGHMHENFGKDKIGKSVVWNVGSAMDGKFLVMEI
jgi:Icc-related predicted phosphoesterase